MIYLDNSATTRPYEPVLRLSMKMMGEDFGNPSSLHRMGLSAEKAVTKARRQLKEALMAKDRQVVFTSGGTEADNLAILGTASAWARKGKRILLSAVEHPAVYEAAKGLAMGGFEIVEIPVDSYGMIRLDALKAAISPETILISVMHVNNEVGTIQPIDEINRIKGEAVFHTDAVQSFGKLPLRGDSADLITLSGHKIHGPKGSGALVCGKNVKLLPQALGGGQEKGMRSGTENVPAIAGLGLAAEMSATVLERRHESVGLLRKTLMEEIKGNIPDIKINSPADGSPYILNVSFLGTRGEVLLHRLEEYGIYVSTGAACSSNKKGKSRVLTAMGLSDKEIEGAIRFSFCEHNTLDEIHETADRLKTAVTMFRKLGSFR